MLCDINCVDGHPTPTVLASARPTRRHRTPILTAWVLLAALANVARGIVTADGPGTHIAAPGVPAFGVDHGGVGRLSVFTPGFPMPGLASGSLLRAGGGRFVLTAAHVVSDGTSVFPDGVSVRFTTGSGTFTGTATKALGQIMPHPGYDGDLFHGFDVAILDLGAPVARDVPRYDLLEVGGSEVGSTLVKVGFGSTGFGTTGDTLAGGTKRIGLNRWESIGLGAMGVTTATGFMNNPHQLTFDFDNGAPANDGFGFFFGMADPGLAADEVMVAPGDSGGPSFLDAGGGRFVIGGVSSYRTRLKAMGGGIVAELPGAPSSDVDGIINSTFGVFGADARVTASAIKTFIDDVTTPDILGDYNFSSVLDAPDIDQLHEAIRFGAPDPFYDLLPDGMVNRADADTWVLALKMTLYGDANFDRAVNIADFARLAGNFNRPGGWADGDFNGTGGTEIGDFSLLASNFNLVAPAGRAAVPEPTGLLGLVAFASFVRRRR